MTLTILAMNEGWLDTRLRLMLRCGAGEAWAVPLRINAPPKPYHNFTSISMCVDG
ncbi:MAG: hypothetical protein ACUVSW_18130 [Roseiflexus sp.]